MSYPNRNDSWHRDPRNSDPWRWLLALCLCNTIAVIVLTIKIATLSGGMP